MAEDWQTILTKALDGNDDALERLCKSYLRPKIYAQALKHLRNRADADDVAQNVFQKLLPSLSSIRTRELAAFEAFVAKSTKRACIDAQRRRKPDISLSEAGVGQEPAADADMHKEIELLQLRALLRTAMEKHLTEEERNVVAMRIFLEYSFRKIADEFKIPLTTLHARYQQALKKIGRSPELLAYRDEKRRPVLYDG